MCGPWRRLWAKIVLFSGCSDSIIRKKREAATKMIAAYDLGGMTVLFSYTSPAGENYQAMNINFSL